MSYIYAINFADSLRSYTKANKQEVGFKRTDQSEAAQLKRINTNCYTQLYLFHLHIHHAKSSPIMSHGVNASLC